MDKEWNLNKKLSLHVQANEMATAKRASKQK